MPRPENVDESLVRNTRLTPATIALSNAGAEHRDLAVEAGACGGEFDEGENVRTAAVP